MLIKSHRLNYKGGLEKAYVDRSRWSPGAWKEGIPMPYILRAPNCPRKGVDGTERAYPSAERGAPDGPSSRTPARNFLPLIPRSLSRLHIRDLEIPHRDRMYPLKDASTQSDWQVCSAIKLIHLASKKLVCQLSSPVPFSKMAPERDF